MKPKEDVYQYLINNENLTGAVYDEDLDFILIMKDNKKNEEQILSEKDEISKRLAQIVSGKNKKNKVMIKIFDESEFKKAIRTIKDENNDGISTGKTISRIIRENIDDKIILNIFKNKKIIKDTPDNSIKFLIELIDITKKDIKIKRLK